MGLDVYVGTLTRYYADEWETVVHQAAREIGVSANVILLHEQPDAVRDPRAIEPVVLTWRESLNASLGNHLTTPLAWNEGLGPPYFTDRPAWDCYSALLIWAAHEEHADSDLPTIAPDDWSTDPAVRRSQSEPSRYGQLLYGPELWLPGEFDFTFQSEDVAGNSITIGSVRALNAQLQDLNQRTWRAGEATLDVWRQSGAEYGAPLERSARFGCTIISRLAKAALDHGLPMKLDY